MEILDGPLTHGGKRAGAGRKPGYSPKEAEALMAETLKAQEPSGETRTAVDYAKARARKEAALADLNELDYKVKSGEYIARVAVQEACATLLATLAQALRSLPDNLERRHNLSPEIAEQIEVTIDATLSDLATGLEMFTGGSL